MPKDEDRTRHSWLRYSHLGFQFALTMLLLVLAGTWADREFGTTPWCTLAGSLLGITAALWSVIRETR
jgi:F0F1-type ATP synthase assembly protein I